MNNTDTLIILTPGFPHPEADTSCLPMQQSFVRMMKEAYPNLNIVILSFQYPYFKKTYAWQGATVMSFAGRNKGGLARLLLRQKLYATLKKIHHSNKITGILSFWYNECAWVGKRFADRNNLKHYCWLLGQDARKENKYPGRLHARADELIALSDFLQDEFERNHGIRPLHVVPAAVDPRQFSDAPQRRDIDILAAGSLIPLKRYEIFIEIVAEIKKKLPYIKAALIGDGPEKEKLQDRITSAALDENIILTGEIPHPEVLQMMQKSKVFVHTSSFEGFGVVLIEALQAGCHVTGFNRPMKQEIEHWHIVYNYEQMEERIMEVLQNPATIYKSMTPFSMHDTVQKMAALFST